jgi:catechol-2,3-dioxygenase
VAAKRSFDRAVEDVGNILALEHLNLTVPDQNTAAMFYVSGLGFTRDPYVDFGVFNFNNMWVNVGDQQFHLPQGKAQKFRGVIGLVVPDLDQLRWRLEQVGRALKDTQFAWRTFGDCVAMTCPWGNQIRCHAPDGAMSLGIRYLDMDVPRGAAAGVARFYREIFATPAAHANGRAEVQIGTNQTLRFVETDNVADYDGHHVAIYVANFSAAHDWLAAKSLVTEESDQHQYRFQAIVDPNGGNEKLCEIEHEVRSMKHPMWGRNLTNRNAGQTFLTFRRGREAFVP